MTGLDGEEQLNVIKFQFLIVNAILRSKMWSSTGETTTITTTQLSTMLYAKNRLTHNCHNERLRAEINTSFLTVLASQRNLNVLENKSRTNYSHLTSFIRQKAALSVITIIMQTITNSNLNKFQC